MADQAQTQRTSTAQAPTSTTTGGGIMQVEGLPEGVLKALGQNRTTNAIPPAAQKAAVDLAAKITLDTTDLLFSVSEKTRNEMSAISNEMIGDTKLGDVSHINAVFSKFANVEKTLDVSKVHQPIGPVTRLLIAVFGKRFEPLFRFLERYKKVKTVIAEERAKTEELEATQVTSKRQFEVLKGRTLDNFRAYEIAIAAGEIVLDRERLNFLQRLKALQESENPQDVVKLTELKDMRRKLVRLDNRVTAMQVVRVDSILDFEVLDMAVNNADNLRQSLYDIRVQTIPQLEKAVAIAIKVYEQRQAAAVGSKVQGQVTRLRESNVTALGHAQEEIYKVTMKHAEEADAVAAAMEALVGVISRGTELMKESETINAQVREKMKNAEARFKEALEKDLKEAATKD